MLEENDDVVLGILAVVLSRVCVYFNTYDSSLLYLRFIRGFSKIDSTTNSFINQYIYYYISRLIKYYRL